MKRPRPTVVEKIQAQQQPAQPQILLEDVANLLQALRQGGLLALKGAEIAAVGASMGRLEAAIAPFLNKQPQASPAPAAPPPEAAKG
jgi:hypothetical protein